MCGVRCVLDVVDGRCVGVWKAVATLQKSNEMTIADFMVCVAITTFAYELSSNYQFYECMC